MPTYAAESKRLWLQDLNEEDHLDMFFKINSEPRSMLWSTQACHTSPDESLILMQQKNPTPEKPWMKQYAIILRTDPTKAVNDSLKPKMIGVIGTPREAEIAYKLYPDYWGNGFMTEALGLFLGLFWAQASNKDHLNITAFADAENSASQHVLERAGFKKGRLLRNHYMRAINIQSGKRSDLQCFYLDRPGIFADGDHDRFFRQAPDRPSLTEEDVASIRNTLENDGIVRGYIR